MKWKQFLGAVVLSGILGSSAGIAHRYFAVKSQIKQNQSFLDSVDYRIHSANSGIEEAEVVLVGENHCATEGLISKIMGKYAQDGTIILLEGQPIGDDISHLLEGCDSAENLDKMLAMWEGADIKLKSHFYGIKNPVLYGVRDKQVKVFGADDPAILALCREYKKEFLRLKEVVNSGKANNVEEERCRSLGAALLELDKKREEECFIKMIESAKEMGKVFFVVGEYHVSYELKDGERRERIIDYLKRKNIRYAALIPAKDHFVTTDEAIKYHSADDIDIKKYKLKVKK